MNSRTIKLLLISLGMVLSFTASAQTTHIYEGMSNSNFHAHVTYLNNGGIRVGWFKLKPQVKRIGGWSCSRDGNALNCKEPNGITQHIYLSGNGQFLSGLAQRFKLIKKVKK